MQKQKPSDCSSLGEFIEKDGGVGGRVELRYPQLESRLTVLAPRCSLRRARVCVISTIVNMVRKDSYSSRT